MPASGRKMSLNRIPCEEHESAELETQRLPTLRRSGELSGHDNARDRVCWIPCSLLTTKQVASLLNVAARTNCQWAVTGVLPGFKLGRQWRFRQGDISRFLEERLG